MSIALGAHDLGHAEKLAWEYPFTFRNRPCSIALRKFGLRLYLTCQGDEDSESLNATAREIVGKISAASRCIERRVLAVIAKAELQAGRITVRNQYGRLRAMYSFFRRLADRAYSGNGLLIGDLPNSNFSGTTPEAQEIAHQLQMTIGGPIARDQEGFYATIAMINAYFSLIEHALVLSLPATDFNPQQESLTGFIGSKIFEKYDRVFDVQHDVKAKKFQVRLRGAAEVWRNPYGHGAFDKDHGTLYFHVPEVGAFPAILSDIRSHPTFEFLPGRERIFDEACTLFDELDDWFRSSPIRHGVRWVEAGLDVSFDSASLERFRSAMAGGDQSFETFLSSAAYADDQATNMDW